MTCGTHLTQDEYELIEEAQRNGQDISKERVLNNCRVGAYPATSVTRKPIAEMAGSGYSIPICHLHAAQSPETFYTGDTWPSISQFMDLFTNRTALEEALELKVPQGLSVYEIRYFKDMWHQLTALIKQNNPREQESQCPLARHLFNQADPSSSGWSPIINVGGERF